MAANLDDFFAKKDKKRKNKNQSSVLSAVTLVRELEEGARQSEYSSRREGKTTAAMELLGLDTNDNDWKDFDEVEKRDYTGLKVKEMSIQDQEEEHRRLVEKTDQVPEIQPWKSKEDTVAAIISSREVDVLAIEEQDEKGEEPEKLKEQEASESAKPDETEAVQDQDKEKSEEKSETKSEEKSEEKAESEGEKEKDEKDKDQDKDKDKDKPEGTETSDKTGDNSKPKKYVPPRERLDGEVKILEPVKLSRLTGGSSRFQGGKRTPNIDDEKAFPSLG